VWTSFGWRLSTYHVPVSASDSFRGLLDRVTAHSLAAPAPLPVPAPGTGVHEWGSLKAVGTDLFGNGLFPFETISILLLIAVVGAIAIARPLKDDEP